MLRNFRLLNAVGIVLLCCAAVVLADDSKTHVREAPDFSPPPVPEFMLRKSSNQFSMDEMHMQAEAAARPVRARIHVPLSQDDKVKAISPPSADARE